MVGLEHAKELQCIFDGTKQLPNKLPDCFQIKRPIHYPHLSVCPNSYVRYQAYCFCFAQLPGSDRGYTRKFGSFGSV